MQIKTLNEMDVDTLRDLLVIAANKIEGSNLTTVKNVMKIDAQFQFAIRQIQLITSCALELMGRIEESESNNQRERVE